MSEEQRVGDLEINQDLEFQERSWTTQRVGWVIIAFLILAGFLGVFGKGIAANATAGEEDSPLRVEYDRFVRTQSPITLVMRLGAGVDRVRVSRAYLEAMQIENITPQPEAVEATKNHYIYVFRRASNASESISVMFDLRPQSLGAISGQASVDGGTTHDFRQFIYP